MKILVTGATGFVGNEIINKLLENGFEAIGTSKNGQTDKFKVIKADITDSKSTALLFENENFEAVIHCAGLAHQFGEIDKKRFDSVNAEGTANVVRSAVNSKIRHFILISSTAVYGFHRTKMSEEIECQPDTDYAKSKLSAELICTSICEGDDVPVTILRLAPVLGEKGIGNVPRLIRTIYKNRFFWIGKGKNKKSLIYVGDIADACVTLLLEKKNKTEIFNLSAPPIKMSELVGIISQTLNKKVPKVSIPAQLPKFLLTVASRITGSNLIERTSKTIEKWLSDDIYPADKIKNEYGFTPKTSIAEAVRKQCLWFLNQQNNK